jgi:hypothetical protein
LLPAWGVLFALVQSARTDFHCLTSWTAFRAPGVRCSTGCCTTNADVAFSACSSLTALTFAALVGRRCLHRRQPALLLWMLGLLCFAISTAAQALGGLRGWDPQTYRWWYLSGAFYTAAFLGMGSIYLVAPQPVAHGIMVSLAVGALMVAPLVLLAPLDLALLPAAGEVPTGRAVHEAVRVATPLFNIFGAAALVLGALWGALQFWRGGRASRAGANLLIAAGAIVPSFASGLTRFGLTATLALGQLVGLLLILAGFLLAMRTPSPNSAQSPRFEKTL